MTKPTAKRSLARIFALARTERARLILAFGATVLVAVATALYAYLIGPLLETLFTPDAPSSLSGHLDAFAPSLSGAVTGALGEVWLVPVAILAAAGLKGAGQWAHRTLMASAGERVVARLRREAFAGLTAGALLASRGQRAGDVAARLTRDADQIRDAVTDGVTILLRDALSIVLLLALAVALDPVLAAIAFTAFPVAAVILGVVGKRLRATHKDSDALRGELGADAAEALTALEGIQIDGSAPRLGARFGAKADRLASLHTRIASLRAGHSAFMELAGVGGLAITLVYALHRIHAETLAPEAFVSFFAALLMLYEPLKSVGRANTMMAAGASALDRLDVLRDLPEPPSGEADPGSISTITLDDVTVAYDAGPLFAPISLTLNPGDTLLLRGPSGCGKSSLARVLLGLQPATGGQVRYNDLVLDTIDRAALYPQVGYCGQEVVLLDGTLGDNLDTARHTFEAVRAACDIALASEFIDALPDGLDSHIGERGMKLSGGQRQRLALARALLKGPRLLVLDEALSGVAPEVRASILGGIRAAKPEVIIVAIAHDVVGGMRVEGVRVLDLSDLH